MTKRNFPIPEKCCLNCHFFVQSEQGNAQSVTQLDRASIKYEIFLMPDNSVSTEKKNLGAYWCHKGVWISSPSLYQTTSSLYGEDIKKDKSPDFKGDIKLKRIVYNRGEKCFFLKFSEVMELEAAEELERRQADRREAGKDRALTRKAFWVAFIALLFSIFTSLATLAWNIWKQPCSVATVLRPD